MTKTKKQTFEGKPWKTQEEYFKLVDQYKLFGHELERAVKRDRARTKIPMPHIKIPRGVML